MKNTIRLIVILAATVCSLACEAQTNVVAPTTNFLQSTISYFTGFDTNSQTFSTNSPYQVFTGVKFEAGINEGAVVGFEAQPIAKVPWLTFRDMATLAATVGTIYEDEFDVGAFFTHYDLHYGAFVGVDSLIQKDRWGAIVGIGLDKALTANSFAGVDLERPINDQNRGDIELIIKAGFTF